MARLIDTSDLSTSECILLAEQLWDQARRNPGAIPVTESQLAELRGRLEALDSGKMGKGKPWDIVNNRLLRR
jgi:putative addiction module component (TIGR02574 family)